MSGTLDRAYELLPAPGQDAMTTLRGWYLRSRRYTALTWRTLEWLQRTERWPRERLAEYQEEQFQRILGHAYRTVPFYREIYDAAGVKPQDVKSVNDIGRLPLATKEAFRGAGGRIHSTAFDPRRLWLSHTSGTSGKPLSARYTHEDMQKRFAFFERLYRWYNDRPFRRRASFTGKLMVTESRPGRLYRRNLALRQSLFSSHHLDVAHLDMYVDDLARIAPEQIDGILSPIFVVGQHILRRGFAGRISPRVVIPTSETLWDYMRETIEEAFRCKAANQYSSQEGAPFAYECPSGGFHTCPESGIFEVLRSDGAPCEPGRMGTLVVTSFLSDATPLIRYAIGDTAVISAASCPCGRTSPLLDAVYGRVDDMLYTHEKGIVPRVDSAFKGIPHCIVASQVAQTAVDTFELRLVVDPVSYRPEHGEQIAHNLTRYLGSKAIIRTVIIEELRPGPGGKIKAMVNECRLPDDLALIRDAWNQYQ